MQSFDIDYEHVKGEENIVADSLSRLCPSNDTSLKERALEFTEKEVLSSVDEMLFALEPLIGEIKDEFLCSLTLNVVNDIRCAALSEESEQQYERANPENTDHIVAAGTDIPVPGSSTNKTGQLELANRLWAKIKQQADEIRVRNEVAAKIKAANASEKGDNLDHIGQKRPFLHNIKSRSKE